MDNLADFLQFMKGIGSVAEPNANAYILGIPSESWFTILSVAIGGAFTLFATHLTNRSQAKREEVARKEDRGDALRLKRADFQRTTIIEMQSELQRLSRFLGQSQHLDEMSHGETGIWGKNFLSEEVDNGFRNSMAMLNVLEVRVKDEKIRNLVKKFRKNAVSVSLAKGPEESRSSLDDTISTLDALYERIGHVLRSLDDDEDRVIGH